MTEQLDYLNPKDIYPNPYQPRLSFSTDQLEELAQSIRENGLIQPLVVRRSEVAGYELIAGERRWRAAQLAGLSQVPVIIKTINDQTSMQQAIIENLQRADLNPIEEALAYQNLIQRLGMTHEDIAKSMGKSRPYISNSLRLLNLSQNSKDALIAGQISPGHARLLLSLEAPEAEEGWLEEIQQKDLTVRQLEQALKVTKPSKSSAKNPFINDQEKRLKQLLGRSVSISLQGKETGYLKIPFANLEDFHRLVNNFEELVDKPQD